MPSSMPLLQKRANVLNFDLFENDAVLPDQYLSRRRGGLSPEQRLLFAVLEDALTIYRRRADCWRSRAERAEVVDWMMSDDLTWPFSFVNCCEGLGLDPGAVRSRTVNGHVDIPTYGGLRRVDLRSSRPDEDGVGGRRNVSPYSPTYVA